MDLELIDKVKTTLFDDGSGKLIGDVDFTEEELDELKSYFLHELIVKKAKELSPFTISTFIIFIINKLKIYGKEWEENNFWDKVKLFFDNNSYINQKVIGKLDFNNSLETVLIENGRTIFRNNGGRQFAQTFLFQSYLPEDSILAFIQMAWNYYVEVLDLNYTEKDYCISERLVNFLSRKIDKIDDEQEFSVDGQLYKFKASLKYGITQNKEKTTFLLNRIFLYIHEIFYNNTFSEEGKLESLVFNKISELKKVLVKKNIGKSKKKYTKSDRVYNIKEMKPKYTIDSVEEDCIYISYPKLSLGENESNYIYAHVEIINNSKLIYKSEKIRFKTIATGQLLNAINIDVLDFVEGLDDLHITANLYFDDVLIHSSNDLLFRDYIIFDSNNEKKGLCSADKYYRLVVANDVDINEICSFKNNDDIYQIKEGLYSFFASIGDMIAFKNTTISFGTLKKSNICFREEPIIEKFVSFAKNENKIPLIKNVSDILVTIPGHIEKNKVVIMHRYIDKTKTESVQEYFLTELTHEGNRYILEKNKYELDKKGIHEITIVEVTLDGYKPITSSIEYVHDLKFEYFYNKIGYINGIFKFDFKVLSNNYSLDVSRKNNIEFIEFNDEYKIKISLPYLNWKFGSNFDNVVHSKVQEENDPIFVDQILSSKETIDFITNLEVSNVYIQFDTGVIVDLEKIEDKRYKLSSVLNRKERCGTIYAEIKDIGVCELFTLRYLPFFIDDYLGDCFKLDNNRLYIDFSKKIMRGNSDYVVNLSVIKDTNDKLILKGLKIDEVNIIDDVNLKDSYYECEISCQVKNANLLGPMIKLDSFDDVFIGDYYKVLFNDCNKICLVKSKIGDNETIKFRDTYIENIKFIHIDEFNEYWYSGYLSCGKDKGFKVKFSIKDEDYIRKIEKDSRKMYINKSDKKFTIEEINYENVFDYNSINYK